VQAVSIREAGGVTTVEDVTVPFRAPGEHHDDMTPAAALWLTRTAGAVDAARFGPLLQVILTGRLSVTPHDGPTRTLTSGDLLHVDVRTAGAYREESDGDTWRLLVSTPRWRPAPGSVPPVDAPSPSRRGRPSLNWMYDDGGRSRSEPLRWPAPLAPLPDVEHWPASDGIFLSRRVYGEEQAVVGPAWHRAPRRQLAVTLSGSGANLTGDGTRTAMHPGDFVFLEDTTGEGHRSFGSGDRRILFVTVADGSLRLPREC
jgi:hypothetical protein